MTWIPLEWWWPKCPSELDRSASTGEKNTFETWNSKFQNWHFNSPSIFLGQKLKTFMLSTSTKHIFPNQKHEKFNDFSTFTFPLEKANLMGWSPVCQGGICHARDREGGLRTGLWCQCGFINSEHLGLMPSYTTLEDTPWIPGVFFFIDPIGRVCVNHLDLWTPSGSVVYVLLMYSWT